MSDGTLPEIAEACGLTYRQVDYWTRVGLLRTKPGPGGHGHVRELKDGELDIAWWMSVLVPCGFPPAVAADAARQMATSKTLRFCINGLWFQIDPLAEEQTS